MRTLASSSTVPKSARTSPAALPGVWSRTTNPMADAKSSRAHRASHEAVRHCPHRRRQPRRRNHATAHPAAPTDRCRPRTAARPPHGRGGRATAERVNPPGPPHQQLITQTPVRKPPPHPRSRGHGADRRPAHRRDRDTAAHRPGHHGPAAPVAGWDAGVDRLRNPRGRQRQIRMRCQSGTSSRCH